MSRVWLLAGSVTGFVSVAAGALGAHALSNVLTPDRASTFELGTRYAFVHALVLLVIGALAAVRPSRALTAAGACTLTGTVLFSGSLWGLALSELRPLGYVTPLGGLALLAGWLALAIAAWRRPEGGDAHAKG